MLLIPCPHCGPPDEAEFDHGGPLRPLPALDGAGDAATWQRALHHAPTPRGPVTELWYHRSGCETWLAVTRDTVTHDITHARAMGREGRTG